METHAPPLAGMLAGMLRHERDKEASATRRTTASDGERQLQSACEGKRYREWGKKRRIKREDKDLKCKREIATVEARRETDKDKRSASCLRWRKKNRVKGVKKERKRETERERGLERHAAMARTGGRKRGPPRLGSSRDSTPTQLSSSLLAFSLSSFSVRSNTARYGSIAPCSKDPLRDGSSLPRWYRQVPSVADSPTHRCRTARQGDTRGS